jgi:acetylornithine deacetylase/succinyl-diaminopimelate desuccinylase-like protein
MSTEENGMETTLARIDALADELMSLTRDLANTYSPPGHERPAADVARAWLDANGFSYDVYAADPERPSIAARLSGAAPERHPSLLFNSHFDQPISREHDHLRLRDHLNPRYTSAWIDGDRVYGYGAVNDKGPMACWCIAAKALKESDARLGGDLLLTFVAGEIGQAQVDEFQGSRYDGTGYGARELVEAGVKADYALVAETTGFTPAWLMLGKANYKITVLAGPSRYTPHIPRPVPLPENPNAIVRSANVVLALESWAERYQAEHTSRYQGGLVVPKANLGAIRSGVPYNLERVPEVCVLYLDVRTLPGADPEPIRRSLEELVAAQDVECTVELTSFHDGAESPDPSHVLGALRRSHEAQFGEPMQEAIPVMASQWRDTIPFAHAGVPAVTYGPSLPTGGRDEYFMTRDDLVSAAKVYARLALDLCNGPRP